MKISFSKDVAAKSGAALIVLGAKAKSVYHDIDGAVLAAAAKAANFKGAKGNKFSTYLMTGDKAVQVIATGRGKAENFDYELCVASVVKSLRGSGETALTVHLAGTDASADDAARVALGARLAGYIFDTHKSAATKSKKAPLKTVKITCNDPSAAKKAYDNYYGPVGDGTILARDLVNDPPNVVYPKAYAARIKKLSDLGLKVEVLGEKRMATLGMHALLGVGLGSPRESQMVIMRWEGGKKGVKPVCLVGKGVTFDTGGISLKPGRNMWDMKGDMGGSAAVVGTMMALASRKAKANVIGVVGLVENMPDGLAQLPGDIVTSMSGQTIEVQNTDAEGRLVLADALHYSVTKFKPAAMINLATLTGAIISALGHDHAGLFSNNDDLADQILAASETSPDKTWRMPLAPSYDKLLDSPNADMKNIGGPAAGSITAGQFLQRFVGKTTPWAHLDIAGTGMKNHRTDPREPTFGTGFGVRLLNRWVADNFEG
ncbi:MAG: leucyl aminopeptidase [Litorimonas sp.]